MYICVYISVHRILKYNLRRLLASESSSSGQCHINLMYSLIYFGCILGTRKKTFLLTFALRTLLRQDDNNNGVERTSSFCDRNLMCNLCTTSPVRCNFKSLIFTHTFLSHFHRKYFCYVNFLSLEGWRKKIDNFLFFYSVFTSCDVIFPYQEISSSLLAAAALEFHSLRFLVVRRNRKRSFDLSHRKIYKCFRWFFYNIYCIDKNLNLINF